MVNYIRINKYRAIYYTQKNKTRIETASEFTTNAALIANIRTQILRYLNHKYDNPFQA